MGILALLVLRGIYALIVPQQRLKARKDAKPVKSSLLDEAGQASLDPHGDASQ